MTEMGHNWPSLSLGSRRVPKPGTATPVPELNLLQDAERGIDLDAGRYALRMRRGSSITLAGTIISIVPNPLANRAIIEFHAVNDMVTEPDTDIGMRLYIARH